MALYFTLIKCHRSEELLLRLPAINESRNSTIKMKNKILAMEAAPAAIPKKPKIPAMIAITRKITVQRNICFVFRLLIIICM